MVTLITRPRPGATGAERARVRLLQKLAEVGPPAPTKETRQNFRSMLRKADKMAKREARKMGIKA